MAAKKIKLQEEAVSEILVPDPNSESGAEAISVENEFGEWIAGSEPEPKKETDFYFPLH